MTTEYTIMPNHHELKWIRERYEEALRDNPDEPQLSAQDMGTLLAEADRLRAELAETRRVADRNNAAFMKAVDELTAENTALAGNVREFLDDEREIARRLSEVDDQNEKMRLLGLCEARKTMREYLGDDVPVRRSCGAKSEFFADDIVYTIGCGKDHGHRDPHYSFTAERGWVDGGVPFRAALGETGGTEEGPSKDEPWLCPCGVVNFGPLGECTHAYPGEQR